MNFVDVILPLHIPATLTYAIPNYLKNNDLVGKRVIIPIKKKFFTGVVQRMHDVPPTAYQVKYVEDLLDDAPILQPQHLNFWQWVADYYSAYLGDVMQAALPAALKLGSETYIVLHPDYDESNEKNLALNEKEYLIAEALSLQNRISVAEVAAILGQKTVFPTIKTLIQKKVAVISEEVLQKYKQKKEKIVRLAAEYRHRQLLDQAFVLLEKRSPKQADILMMYLSALPNHDFMSVSSLAKQAKTNAETVLKLVEKGIFELQDRDVSRLQYDDVPLKNAAEITLSDAQNTAFEEIKHSWQTKNVTLLRGVTGSGKTLIYTKLIQEVLQTQAQVLYLVPEIALTAQLINRLRQYFGDLVGIYHSRFSDNERAELWYKVASGEVRVVLGVRSSVFLPFTKLGLVVIDEEHEASYKQQEPTPRYHARSCAMLLADRHGAKTLLGSATPSLESYHHATNGKYGLVVLNERFGGIQMPQIMLVDIKDETMRKTMRQSFSSKLIDHINSALAKNEQVILLQNRRGYVPVHECRVCGWVPDCINCDISLTYHKATHQLRCHYCGYYTPPIAVCGACGSPDVKTRGFGTEKIEEEIGQFFPDKKTARLDQDVTKTKHAFSRIITDFEQNKTDILIGTQMVAKGLDFDNVTLVGVLDADQALTYPDFRANERCFQLLSQVSGRAGRRNVQGKVIVQTKRVELPIFAVIVEADYPKFAENELRQRLEFGYPPYTKLIKITVRHLHFDGAQLSARALVAALQPGLGNIVLGPAVPPIGRIRNLYYQEILLKINPNQHSLPKIKQHIAQQLVLLQSLTAHKNTQFMVDVDPE